MSCNCSSLVILASNTGNTRTFLPFLHSNCEKTLQVCEDFSVSPINYDRIAIGTYTWGNGKLPKALKEYLIENQNNFADKKIFIFGSGNSIYPKFCKAVDSVEKIVTDCGAIVVGKVKFEQRFNLNEFKESELKQLEKEIIEWDAK